MLCRVVLLVLAELAVSGLAWGCVIQAGPGHRGSAGHLSPPPCTGVLAPRDFLKAVCEAQESQQKHRMPLEAWA